MEKKKYFKALTIAGSDSGGGAGIQADLKTFSALGCYGMSVVTALTAQNTLGVQSVLPVPSEFIRWQIRSVLSDLGTDAVKIGMLHSSEVIQTVTDELIRFEIQKIVLDPVMISKSGHALLQEEAISALREILLPRCLIVTPNLPEAEKLTGFAIDSEAQMIRAGERILEMGPAIVVVKGGHLAGSKLSSDCVCSRGANGEFEFHWFRAERMESKNTHGTGCTYSAAIASGLAQGLPVLAAISRAKDFLSQALQAGTQYEIGSGHGPVHHFFDQWTD